MALTDCPTETTYNYYIHINELIHVRQFVSNLLDIELHHFFSQLAQYRLVWLRFCLQLSYALFFRLLRANTANHYIT